MVDLSVKYRPKSFSTMVGQRHLVAEGAPLRLMVESGAKSHLFFYGPPGTGKTTIARVIATQDDSPFYEMNATTLKIEQLRKIFELHKNTLLKPLIFIDEVHRLSKTQQEVLLPVMELNSVTVMGASTQNPYHSLTAAIRSRSMLFELHPLTVDELEELLLYIAQKESIELDNEAKEYLLHSSGADARAMFKLLEASIATKKEITKELLHSIRPNAMQGGNSEDTVHYNLISAFIKSIRGSDPDAAIYYLARMIEGGESADFIARRLVILASEDIGNANPTALTLASSALSSVAQIGFPEARIILSQTAIYLAASPKSNSAYEAINSAQKAVKNGLNMPIPEHIQDSAKNYLYPHDFGGWVEQSYLHTPQKFVNLKPIGHEKRLMEWLGKIREK